MIVVGTSGVVYPAASLPEMAVKKHGVAVIEVNPEPSNLTDAVHIFLQGPSGQVLPVLVEEMKKRGKKEGKESKHNKSEKKNKKKKKKKKNKKEKEEDKEGKPEPENDEKPDVAATTD